MTVVYLKPGKGSEYFKYIKFARAFTKTTAYYSQYDRWL